MRLISFKTGEHTSWGAVQGDGVIDLGQRLKPSEGQSLQHVIAAGRLAETAKAAQGLDADHALADIEYLPPIAQPEKIACIGVNYANRNAEYKDGSEAPKFPSVFMRAPDSLTGHGQPLWRPPESAQLDYEGEIVVVIGKAGRRISEEQAFDYIAGLSVANEGTLRDWVRHAKFNVTQGKNFVNSGSIGPWLVTADEFTAEGLTDMRVSTHVNGEKRQDDTTANMMFPIAYIISYLSQFYQLKPGDVILTGTPNGAGARFDPPKYLVPGDVVEVSVDGVGTLSNTIIDEPLS